MDLRDVMEFDQVVQVHVGGRVTRLDADAPEVYLDASWDEDGDAHVSDADERDMITHLKSQGWEVLTGWTGQYGYNGSLMHPSEFVGGRLADHIRETPGLYVCLHVEIIPGDDRGPEPVGWIVARR